MNTKTVNKLVNALEEQTQALQDVLDALKTYQEYLEEQTNE